MGLGKGTGSAGRYETQLMFGLLRFRGTAQRTGPDRWASLVEAMVAGQMLVAISEVALAKLAGGIALFLEHRDSESRG